MKIKLNYLKIKLIAYMFLSEIVVYEKTSDCCCIHKIWRQTFKNK